jgi:hypothetical protein
VAAEAAVGEAAAVAAGLAVAEEMAADLVVLAGEVPVAVGPQAVGRLIVKILSKRRRTFE